MSAFATFGAIARVAGFSLLAAFGSRAESPREARTTIADGHRVAYRVMGQGRPALAMIAGLGDGMASFESAAQELSKTNTVILYDRAGYGGSEAGAGPRDAEAAARELSAVLKASGVEGPVVILGHSLGGLFAEYYAAKHSDAVAGLILEDSRPADFTRRCEARRDTGMCAPPGWIMWFMPKGARDETIALAWTMVEVEAAPRFADKPVLVLSRPAGNADAFETLWTKAQGDLAARYARARYRAAPAGGHYLHRDESNWFVREVRTFLARANG